MARISREPLQFFFGLLAVDEGVFDVGHHLVEGFGQVANFGSRQILLTRHPFR